MTDLAQWLLIAPVALPLLGAAIGLCLMVISHHWERAALFGATFGLASACAAALSLVVVILVADLDSINVHNGAWLSTAGMRPQQINWGWHADRSAALRLAVLTTLALLTVIYSGDKGRTATDALGRIAMSVIVASACGLVLASTFVQMLACWLALSAGTLLLTSESSSSSASNGKRRTLLAGVVADLLLFGAVVLIGSGGGSNAFTDVLSDEGLRRLATDNPAIIGLIGSLIVISSFCRCGLFPFFGWHAQASGWDSQTNIAVYAIGYVPSGIWMLLKCQPLLAVSETSLSLLGGLGALAAILGAFVAAGQQETTRRLAYVVASQGAVILVALASGSPRVVALCICHQCVISIAAFLLFGSLRADRFALRISSFAACCGAFAIAGLVPFGWTHHLLIETNAQPMVVASIPAADADLAADATNPSSATPSHWDWVYALWLSQGLAAFAVARGLAGPRGLNDTTIPTAQTSLLPPPIVAFVGVLLLGGAAAYWLLQLMTTPVSTGEWTRWGLGQGLVLLGVVAGWRCGHYTSSNSDGGAWQSIARLSRERMYIDPLFETLLGNPWFMISRGFARAADATALDRAWRRLVVHGASWMGTQIEGLQLSRIDFYVAAMLLGTATLLLTLILVA